MRSKKFLKNLDNLPKEINFADNNEFKFKKTKLKFSPPQIHGDNDRFGYVIQTTIEEDFKFLHTSDILGPATDKQTNYIIDENPKMIISDGPMPFYVGQAIPNIIKIIENTDVQTYIIS